MLANGSKLGYRENSAAQYEDLPGLKEIPEMGADGEKVENTPLTAKQKQYEMGIRETLETSYTSLRTITRNLDQFTAS